MKKALIAIAAVLLLGGCKNNTEVLTGTSETFSETASQTETAAETVTETSAETTAEETTSAKFEYPEPILPPEAIKIDVGGIGGDKKFNFDCTLLDNENILVLCTFKQEGRVAADGGIFGISDGGEKTRFNIPRTDADRFFVRDSIYFDEENILCKIYGCENNGYVYDNTVLSVTTVYTDHSFESSARGRSSFWDWKKYKLPGGRIISRSTYGNIRDDESGDLLLNSVFEGSDSKSNVTYSYAFPIDENRFVYSMWGYEWTWGFGIYDFTTGTARDVPDVFDYRPIGYCDGKIYSYYSTHDGGTDNILYVTDVNTLETTAFHKFETDEKEYLSENDFVYSYEMTPNGKFLLNIDEDSSTHKVILYSTDTLEPVREYEFKNTDIKPWYVQFTNDGKAVLTDYKHKCLYVLDLNK